MRVQVYIREVYGNEVTYPACEKARAFADIAGTKTLTENTLAGIKALGYEVQEIPRPRG